MPLYQQMRKHAFQDQIKGRCVCVCVNLHGWLWHPNCLKVIYESSERLMLEKATIETTPKRHTGLGEKGCNDCILLQFEVRFFSVLCNLPTKFHGVLGGAKHQVTPRMLLREGWPMSACTRGSVLFWMPSQQWESGLASLNLLPFILPISSPVWHIPWSLVCQEKGNCCQEALNWASHGFFSCSGDFSYAGVWAGPMWWLRDIFGFSMM